MGPMFAVTNGSYLANGKAFDNKLEAFNSTVPYGHWPHWDFNEIFFSKFKWNKEPTETLEELYVKRAQQIRKKYDYLILSYSGGADSQNIAEVFTRYKINLNELLNRSVKKNIETNNQSVEPDRMSNESIWAAWPGYKKLKERQPNLKYTYWDWGQDILDSWKDKKNHKDIPNHFYPPYFAHRELVNRCDVPKWAKKIGVIHSIDKPKIKYKDGKFFFYFLDKLCIPRSLDVLWNYEQEIGHEYFYWSPESIMILIKQGHVIKKFLKNNPDILARLDSMKTEDYNSMVNKLVYPWYNKNIWQAKKPTNWIFLEEDNWFFKKIERDHIYYRLLRTYSDAVQKIYKHNKEESQTENGYYTLPGCMSKFYDLGE